MCICNAHLGELCKPRERERYIYIYTHTVILYICVYLYIYMYVCIYMCVCISFFYVYMGFCLYVSICKYVYLLFLWIYRLIPVCAHLCKICISWIHICLVIYIYIYLHLHMLYNRQPWVIFTTRSQVQLPSPQQLMQWSHQRQGDNSLGGRSYASSTTFVGTRHILKKVWKKEKTIDVWPGTLIPSIPSWVQYNDASRFCLCNDVPTLYRIWLGPPLTWTQLCRESSLGKLDHSTAACAS